MLIKAKVVQVAADHVVLDREFEGSTKVPFAVSTAQLCHLQTY